MRTNVTWKVHAITGFQGGVIWYRGAWGFAVGACVVNNVIGEIHRRDYTIADAEALAAWLNEREAGYPPRKLTQRSCEHPELHEDEVRKTRLMDVLHRCKTASGLYLDLLAAEMRLFRTPGLVESDASLRARVQQTVRSALAELP